MGIIDDLRRKREQKKQAEEAERERLQREGEARQKAEHDRAAARQAEQDRQKQHAIDRANLPQKRQNEAGAAERLFVDQATKERVRVAAAQSPDEQSRAREQQDRQKIATEKEYKLEPQKPAPTIGPGGVSRTAVRESLAQKLAREKAERTSSPEQSPAPTLKQYPKPEVARVEDRLLTKEQQSLRRISDALKAHRIDRVTALDRELGVLTRQSNENSGKARTLKQDHSRGRKLTDEG